MFKFEELTSRDGVFDTFVYWILVLQKPLPKSCASVQALKELMSYHYDIEEQAYTLEMLRTDKRLLFSYLRPIAPVTVAWKWTPFDLAKSILGSPLRREKGRGSQPPALAMWKPKYLGAWGPKKLSEDARHFAFLLRIACSAAIAAKGKVLLVGAAGWSYSSCREELMMNPDTALLMHEAGYVYTDRIPQ